MQLINQEKVKNSVVTANRRTRRYENNNSGEQFQFIEQNNLLYCYSNPPSTWTEATQTVQVNKRSPASTNNFVQAHRHEQDSTQC